MHGSWEIYFSCALPSYVHYNIEPPISLKDVVYLKQTSLGSLLAGYFLCVPFKKSGDFLSLFPFM